MPAVKKARKECGCGQDHKSVAECEGAERQAVHVEISGWYVFVYFLFHLLLSWCDSEKHSTELIMVC